MKNKRSLGKKEGKKIVRGGERKVDKDKWGSQRGKERREKGTGIANGCELTAKAIWMYTCQMGKE